MNRLKLPSSPVWGMLFLLLIGGLYVPPADAHARRENYVWINIEKDHVDGRFEINKSDIKHKLGIDLDAIGENTLDGVIATASEVQAYLEDNFSLSFNGQEMKLQFLEPGLFNDEGKFIQYHFRVDGVPENDLVFVRNTVFLGEEFLQKDPLHRSLVLVDYNKYRGLDFGHENTALVFGPHLQEAEFSVIDPPGILIWKDFFYQGLLHIWVGLDHMLFLFVLLLTAVLLPYGTGWEPVPRARDAFFNTVKIITVFTISHSFTLALAALGFVNVPSAPVEAIIALSISVVALNNVFRFFKSHTWALIFVFGLAHGLGFASALGELQFRNVDLKKVLIMFNVGVEIGQVAIVILVLPILFYFRKTQNYRFIIMPALSLASVALSGYWLGSRLDWWS